MKNELIMLPLAMELVAASRHTDNIIQFMRKREGAQEMGVTRKGMTLRAYNNKPANGAAS
jgi:hypothetical protein